MSCTRRVNTEATIPPGNRLAPVPGWEAYYAVDDEGHVWRLARSTPNKLGRVRRTPLQPLCAHWCTTRRGKYLKVWLRAGDRQLAIWLHRLVLLAWVGPPPFLGAQVRHLDGNPGNNCLYNLAYGSQAENEADKKQKN